MSSGTAAAGCSGRPERCSSTWWPAPLVALPDRSWETPRLGKGLLRGMGAFFVGMGVLQAWPGRGFWSGRAPGSGPPGTLTGMVRQMSQVSQPSVTASWVRSFGSFQAGHGWLVNVGRGGPPGRGGCLLPQRQPPGRPHRRDRRGRALPGRLGPRPGLRVLRRGGHRSQLHDPHGAGVHQRLRGHGAVAGPGSRWPPVLPWPPRAPAGGRPERPPAVPAPRRPGSAGSTGSAPTTSCARCWPSGRSGSC